MKLKFLFIPILAVCLFSGCCENIPLVYSVENTEIDYISPTFNPNGLAVAQRDLPNPLIFNDGKPVKGFRDWSKRRAEISAMIQYYETGFKPSFDKKNLKARMSGDTLYVDITVGGETMHLSSQIFYPSDGPGPFPIMIGASRMGLPHTVLEGRDIAVMNFNERQVNNYGQWGPHDSRGSYAFDKLYPELSENGAYIEWAWGMSRIIDALEILGPELTKIDTKHIGVTGCSYAGKMALFCGAFDERIALTIPQEPGGGGAAVWRYSHTLEEVESLERTDYNWFKESFRDTFSGERVFNIPYDRHELVAMLCPRAVLMFGNTDYQWLADESGYVSMNAAIKVWEHFGIEDRIGYSINGDHPHCMLPEEQYPEAQAFIDKFLLGKEDVDTFVRKAEKFEGITNLDEWIKF